MSHVSDHWFVRLPNGHVLRAANTTIVRQQVGLGKIPAESAVRRSPDEEWIVLEWTREFADIVGPLLAAKAEKATKIADEGVELGGDIRSSPEAAEAGGLSSRLDPARLPTVGVRGMMHELLAALDATLVRKKLAAAALAGLCSGAVVAAAGLPLLEIEGETPWVRWLAATVLLLAIVNAGAGMITRMTVVELTRMRPARWRDGFTGLAGTTFRMAVAQVLTMGVAAGLIAMQRYLPSLLIESTPGSKDTATTAAVIAAGGMLFQIVLWPVFVVALLLPPILVVEKCSVGKALDLWLRLLRVDLGRVFLYEALALGLGLAATLLLALPWVALVTYQPLPELQLAVRFTRWVLTGLALAPLLAYLVVANVFIYINLRYESAPATRR